ncbi:MAG: sigma-70 factor domain-containing protein, partial [Planctomycetota bacterium]
MEESPAPNQPAEQPKREASDGSIDPKRRQRAPDDQGAPVAANAPNAPPAAGPTLEPVSSSKAGGRRSVVDRHDADLVRVYLRQTSGIRLFTRSEEVAAAKRVQQTRERFRSGVMSSDHVLRGVFRLQNDLCSGKLRVDRELEVSAKRMSKSAQILKRLRENLDAFGNLLRENESDFDVVIRKSLPVDERRRAWRRMAKRRQEAVGLAEEPAIKTRNLVTMLQSLEGISRRMETLKGRLAEARAKG